MGGWRNGSVVTAAIVVLAALIIPGVTRVSATEHHDYHHRRHYHHHLRHRRRVPIYHAAILEDAESGKVLYSYHPTLRWPPASMAKMMLLLVTEDEIRAGRVRLDDPVRISERAAETGGSHVGLVAGGVYPLRELMKAALIRSANDAAVAIAEKVAGSVGACVRLMNLKAKSLGMTGTRYRTVDGLPPTPDHDVDVTDAADIAKLARTLIRYHSNLLRWSGLSEAPFDGIKMIHNTNHLVGKFAGCDGLKTGFTYKAGFNLTATAERGNMRLIAVVMGAPSNRERFAQAARLMRWGFAHFSKVVAVRRGQVVPVSVRLPSGGTIRPIAGSGLKVVVPKKYDDKLTYTYDLPRRIWGHVVAGEPVGKILIHCKGSVVGEVPAICPRYVNNRGATDNSAEAAAAD